LHLETLDLNGFGSSIRPINHFDGGHLATVLQLTPYARHVSKYLDASDKGHPFFHHKIPDGVEPAVTGGWEHRVPLGDSAGHDSSARLPGQSLADLFEERFTLYTTYADITIDNSRLTQEETCEKIIMGINNVLKTL
jgi:hypothetical protein